MENHLHPNFIPIYENSRLAVKSFVGKYEKLVDAIYYENEFGDWLRKEFMDEFKKSGFAGLCVKSNFNKFLKMHDQLKDKSSEKTKREYILENLMSENLKPISRNLNDIDIVLNYIKIDEALKLIKKGKANPAHNIFRESALLPIVHYCKEKELPLKMVLSHKYPIIVDYTSHGFEIHFARTLMTFDTNKINALLDYQLAAWKGEFFFPSVVEHGVYNYIANNSPFNNSVCLKKIMQWIENKREFVPNNTDKKFDHWPYSEDKLDELWQLLVERTLVEDNILYKSKFETHKTFAKPVLIWKGSQPQLMALLYLIYKNKQYKGISIHTIACDLFKSKINEFKIKNLNTILNQIIPMLESNSNKKLKIIDGIINKLNLG